MSIPEALAQLRSALHDWRISRNFNRHNISQGSEGHLACVVLGAYTAQGSGVTRATHRARDDGVLPLLINLLAARKQRLPFSSIALTMNSQAPLHRDRNNLGQSSLMSFG
eukprot:633139-Amphidinium_carterae.1